ncbi:hypothetical protein [Ferrimonas futtsuensis]|uniref:hypothetical protein n=1 Tax=Ferrimonas futtsuensis TaxID=364764 RepID=UPI00048527A6|nr:hypothetical protein [Ferrimonas futtsuensis]
MDSYTLRQYAKRDYQPGENEFNPAVMAKVLEQLFDQYKRLDNILFLAEALKLCTDHGVYPPPYILEAVSSDLHRLVCEGQLRGVKVGQSLRKQVIRQVVDGQIMFAAYQLVTHCGESIDNALAMSIENHEQLLKKYGHTRAASTLARKYKGFIADMEPMYFEAVRAVDALGIEPMVPPEDYKGQFSKIDSIPDYIKGCRR